MRDDDPDEDAEDQDDEALLAGLSAHRVAHSPKAKALAEYKAAVADIERSRYEIARLTLQTLINTYDTSEFLAKAKLAIADSWFREGGSNGLAQAEAEYKDFILFYPTLEESAEAQMKVFGGSVRWERDRSRRSSSPPSSCARASWYSTRSLPG